MKDNTTPAAFETWLQENYLLVQRIELVGGKPTFEYMGAVEYEGGSINLGLEVLRSANHKGTLVPGVTIVPVGTPIIDAVHQFHKNKRTDHPRTPMITVTEEKIHWYAPETMLDREYRVCPMAPVMDKLIMAMLEGRARHRDGLRAASMVGIGDPRWIGWLALSYYDWGGSFRNEKDTPRGPIFAAFRDLTHVQQMKLLAPTAA